MANPTERGKTWEQARRLCLKYPLLSLADLARLLDVSRARINECITDLKDERAKLRDDALEHLKKKEHL
jgi:hypothetical protein